MKKTKLFALLLSSLALVGCGENTSDNNKGNTSAAQATLTQEFITPAKLTYSNMRPTYNFYMTTFSFETLKIFSDNSYVLTHSSSMFSAVILPEEGNAAQGNEKQNFLTEYYGTFTKETDELDEDTVYFTISAPTRIVSCYDSLYYLDTDNWTENMKTKTVEKEIGVDDQGKTFTKGEKTFATGKEYLDAHSFESMKLTCALSTSSMEFVALASPSITA